MDNGKDNPSIHYESLKVNRQTASHKAIPTLSELPLKRAAAIHQAINTITSRNHHFSLVDMLDSEDSIQVNRALKNAAPAQETKALDLRRKIWEMEPEKYANELASDNKRMEKDEERKQRETSLINARQILKSRSPSKDRDFKLTLREISNLFDPVSGRIIIPANFDLVSSPIASFYDASHRVGSMTANKGRVELRGYTYYLAAEPITIEEKFRLIGEDLVRTLDFAEKYAYKRGEIANAKDYLLYLGILDLMKYHAMTLFHALTYNERLMKFPQNKEEFYEYQKYRQQVLQLMQTSTRLFYQTLFGADYDRDLDLGKIQQGIPILTNYIRDSMLSEAGNNDKAKARLNARFRNLEVNDPLIIALGVQETVRKNPDTDMIVGIPSGGTEAAMVAQLIYQLKQNRLPQLFFLPVSVHSRLGKAITDQDVAAFLATYYPNLFVGKKILLVDDNSETAHTLDMAAAALKINQAGLIAVHLVDFSTRRLINPNYSMEDEQTFYNPVISPSTLGLTQLNEKGEYVHNSQRRVYIDVAKRQAQRPS